MLGAVDIPTGTQILAPIGAKHLIELRPDLRGKLPRFVHHLADESAVVAGF